jgi:hypothetical protein
MFAAINEKGRVLFVEFSALEVRQVVGAAWSNSAAWPNSGETSWEYGWRRASEGGLRVVPVVVTIEGEK